MKKQVALLGSIGLGAGLMYMFDPDKGKRRRALLRDKALHLKNIGKSETVKAAHDLNNRAYGAFAAVRSLMPEKNVLPDARLEARVRSRLGRSVSHPHAVTTHVEDGCVKLKGPILESEADPLIRKIASMPGIKDVKDELERHAPEEKHPALQGGKLTRSNAKGDWTPAARMLAATAGGGLAAYALLRGGLLGKTLGLAGTGLIARSLIKQPLTEFVSTGSGLHIQKTINIDAPVEEIFDLFSRPEEFPQFMKHVHSVEKTGPARFIWEVDWLPGVQGTLEIQITDVVPNSKFAWKNAGNGRMGHSGELRLEKINDNRTRVYVNMLYSPPGGIFGHLALEFLGSDPKSELDDDLLRVKSFIEKGKVPHDAAANLDNKGDKAMKVREIMTSNPACCLPQTSLRDVAHLMLERNCGVIPIVEDVETRKPVGIITDRDITIDTVALGKDPLGMTAAEIMTFPVVSILPDASLHDCCKKMEEAKIRRMLVVDDQGSLCGIVAQADIARKAPVGETAALVKEVSLATDTAARATG